MIEPTAIADILGIRKQVRTLNDLDQAVSRGLSKNSVTRLVTRLALNAKDARAIRDQVVPLATWKRTTGRLSLHASERTERLARVMAAAEFTWDDDAELVRKWLNNPHPLLGGRSPIAVATTEIGARNVEGLLAKIDYGLPV